MSPRWLYFCFALFLAAICVPRAHASSDRVSFMHDIEVNDTDEVDDAVCFLCSIRVHGKVNGDAVAFLGSILVNGEISGDVVSFLPKAIFLEDFLFGKTDETILPSLEALVERVKARWALSTEATPPEAEVRRQIRPVRSKKNTKSGFTACPISLFAPIIDCIQIRSTPLLTVRENGLSESQQS